ncbi:metal-dependent transcriptional regulator [Hyunsoonleella jejuensis]|uniref:metal-dependent transcriptional regulator n=1 Tax=Hyunsoonleella jejuensis TaxID=419940 RepID=UPI0015A5AD37|nr:metal-dependent transcriptional regulator [Hyunsoonleella jejuensis]
MTLTEENYIKSIYHLGKQGATNVSTNAIAQDMETKASSVTDMVKKLSEKGYADYKKYQGVSLTEKGKTIAINIVRKHRLWEVFLAEKLNFSWDEIHEVAEQLEHIKSKKLISQLDAFLGYPTHDPHGDPIPDETGNIKKIDKILLSEAKEGDHCICVGVQDSSTEFLKYLDKNNIALGVHLKVLQREPFDNSITIKLKDRELVISNVIANNLFVKVT